MTGLVGKLKAARTGVLTLSGFGSLTASAWTAFGTPAGLAASGVALLILEYLTGETR
ncbi:hypothetical protein I5Q34_33170 [Streptomyces sp. AV19]|uniref:hypothetical protein n=1 Tax=Streptomyces sp. AV19 TaxID=2793068 RepID=UPI0018FE3228|nr:hypothetical protein [Streptomyces sp. AV19]MBH1939055.1 hypothetical protein [Streptomyces sp. AV19]MDG4535317.1 hypothetical protein [Streptomyces sp. AV19]